MGNTPSVTDPQNFCVYFNKPIPTQVDFNFCPWCGSKLINARHQEIEFSDIQCTFKDKDLIGSGTYAKVYKGKIRGVDVAIKVPNLEKILPSSSAQEDQDDSSLSFINSASVDSDQPVLLVATPPPPKPVAPQKKRKGFAFFRKLDSEFPPISVGGGPGSMTAITAASSPGDGMERPELGSSGVDSREDGDAEDGESFGDDEPRADAEVEEDETNDGQKESDEPENGADTRYGDRFQNFLGEVKMLRELNHPNICLLMGTCFVHGAKNRLLLIYELMDEDLNSYINNTAKRREVPSLFQRLKIASQIASGLSWVASKGIIHGDLKPTNILRKGAIYKVTDFGLATFEVRVDDFEGGAPIWSAPELLEKRGDASRAVDVFSFGYLLWHILLWKNEEQLYPNIENTAQLIDTVCIRHELPPMQDLPSSLQDLVRQCLAYHESERPTFNHIIQDLNAAMLDAAIPTGDKLARKFWTHFFSSKSGSLQESVPTIIFLEKFLRFTGLSSRDAMSEVAKDFFDPEGRGTVTLEHFGRVVSLFGPLDEELGDAETSSPVMSRHISPVASPTNVSGSLSSPPSRHRPVSPAFKDEGRGGSGSLVGGSKDKKAASGGRARSKSVTAGRIFRDMAELRREPWFCGAVATERVQETLRTDCPGSFLVRYSNNPKAPSSFCLSRVTKHGNVRHHYIVHSQRGPDGAKQFGLHTSKTEVLYAKSLGALIRDPRISALFFLTHPVNKVASFSTKSNTGRTQKECYGYLQAFEFEPSDNDDEANPNVPVSMDLGTSPPTLDLEIGPPRPRSPRKDK